MKTYFMKIITVNLLNFLRRRDKALCNMIYSLQNTLLVSIQIYETKRTKIT